MAVPTVHPSVPALKLANCGAQGGVEPAEVAAELWGSAADAALHEEMSHFVPRLLWSLSWPYCYVVVAHASTGFVVCNAHGDAQAAESSAAQTARQVLERICNRAASFIRTKPALSRGSGPSVASFAGDGTTMPRSIEAVWVDLPLEEASSLCSATRCLAPHAAPSSNDRNILAPVTFSADAAVRVIDESAPAPPTGLYEIAAFLSAEEHDSLCAMFAAWPVACTWRPPPSTPPRRDREHDQSVDNASASGPLPDAGPDDGWTLLQNGRRVRHFGRSFNYATLSADAVARDHLPEWAHALLRRLSDALRPHEAAIDAVAAPYSQWARHGESAAHPAPSDSPGAVAGRFEFDQLTVNAYEPGSGIPPHVDHPVHFGEVVVAISLGTTAVMEFTEVPKRVDPADFFQSTAVLAPSRLEAAPGAAASNPRDVARGRALWPVPLVPGSCLMMVGPARYDYRHAISARKKDFYFTPAPVQTGGGVPLGHTATRGVRYSITFRRTTAAGRLAPTIL